MTIEAPIFVVGVPRSGTTLLQSLLSAHSSTYSLPETHFFPTILPRLSELTLDLQQEDGLNCALALITKLIPYFCRE